MTAIPPEAIQAAADGICGYKCGLSFDTASCPERQWHVAIAHEALKRAERAWPHDPLRRSPESTTGGTATLSAGRLRDMDGLPPQGPPPRGPFGFGKDVRA